MCGFFVHIPGPGRTIERHRIRAATNDLSHRGPDGEGYYFADWIGAGHRRLAILDVSAAGNQPMYSRDGRHLIVYNGEIYNFRELRRELEATGTLFSTGCDTEVVVEAYARWGSACLDRFSGMFAFVVIDLKERSAFVARDQLGIKPLYLCAAPQGLLIASEIKSFRHYVDFTINENALREQFLSRYVAGRQTIFKDIHRIEPGTFLTVDREGSFKTSRYYAVTDSLSRHLDQIPDHREIETVVRDSIERHTLSDVGYNVQLSGGVDSSYITAVLARDLGAPPETFSVALDSTYDEGPYQRFVAQTFGTKHHTFEFDGDDLANSYIRATWHMDIPIVHTSCVFLSLLCDHSRLHSKVILTGEGADELFSGYSRYRISRARALAYRLQRLGMPAAILPPIGKLAGLRTLLARDILLDAHMGADQEEIELLLTDPQQGKDFYNNIAGPFDDLLSKLIAVDQTAYLASMLERQDKMSMAASVESRVPFCAHSIFDLVNGWRPALKIQNGEPKSVLKKLAEAYFPADFVYRRKNGFVLPLAEWLRDESGLGRYLGFLTDQTFRERGLYNVRNVSRLVDRHRNGSADHSKSLMRLISFETWCRLFVDRSIAVAPAAAEPTDLT